MKSYTEVQSFTGYKESLGKEVLALQGVLKILESLFFSMPIPEEVINKYNYLKEAKFRSVGLEFTPITKAQLSIRVGSSRESVNQLDKGISALSIEIMESWIKVIQQIKEGKNYTTPRINQMLNEAQKNSSEKNTKLIKTLEELNEQYMGEAKPLALFCMQREAQCNELRKTIEIQKTEINTLTKIIKTINGRFKNYYEENTKEKIPSVKLNDELGCSEIIIEYMTKLGNDNQWLVEKLAEFGKENETLKKAAITPEVLKEATNAKNLIKAFQKNYNDIVKVTYTINT